MWHGVKYPLPHDIRKLLDLCAPLDSSHDAALGVGLTQFAVRFRYPGEDQPQAWTRRYWLDLARKTHEEVRLRLPAEAKD